MLAILTLPTAGQMDRAAGRPCISLVKNNLSTSNSKPAHNYSDSKCNLFFDSQPKRGENFLNVAFHGLSFRQLQPQASLLLLTQADRC